MDNNSMPSYEELLEINECLGDKLQHMQSIIDEQECIIQELFDVAVMYKKAYFKVEYGIENPL